MKRALVVIAGAAVCLAVTACGEASNAPAASAPAGEAAPAAASTEAPMATADAPAGFPAYLAPIAGANITQKPEDTGGHMMMFTIDKPTADVVAHYRAAMKAAGVTPAIDTSTGTGHMMINSDAPNFSLTFTTEGPNETTVAVSSR